MNTLIALMALVGQPVSLWTEMGTCEGYVVAPQQMVITDGTCSLSDDENAYLYTTDVEEPVAWFTRASRLESGRVIAHFVVMP